MTCGFGGGRAATESLGDGRGPIVLDGGGCLKRTTTSGFLDLRSGSGAQVSVGRWSEGSMTRPSLPIIGCSSRSFSSSVRLAASIACSGVSYRGAGAVVVDALPAFGFKASYESGENGTPVKPRSSVGGGLGLTDFLGGIPRMSGLVDLGLLTPEFDRGSAPSSTGPGDERRRSG